MSSACAVLRSPALPAAATRGRPCARNGKSCVRLRRWEAGRLAQCPLCGLADPDPPYPRGFTRWRPTLSSRTQSSGLEIRTPRSPAPASKPREQPSGWLGVQERNWELTHSRRSIHVFEMNERMWQCPVLKLGEGRDDLDTMERNPTPQKAGATGGVPLSAGETEAVCGPGRVGFGYGHSWRGPVVTRGIGTP